MESLTLDFQLLQYPHGAKEIVNSVKNIIQEFGNGSKLLSITTDNEAANIKALRLLNVFHDDYKYIAHI